MDIKFISSAVARRPGFFTSMRTPALQACLLIGACISTPQAVVAATVCYPDGFCGHSEQTCEDFIPGDGAVCTDDAALMLNPGTDYLFSKGGKAWLVHANKRTPVNADSFDSFLKDISKKHRTQALKDPKILKQVMADTSAARKKSDGQVSPDRLKSIARKLNLRVMDKEAILSADKKAQPVKPEPIFDRWGNMKTKKGCETGGGFWDDGTGQGSCTEPRTGSQK